MNIDNTKKFFIGCASAFEENLAYLSEADSAIGDGDHGISMVKGFRAVKEIILTKDYSDIGSIWLDAGKAIMSKIGGTCGPLFATFFMKAGMLALGKQAVDAELLAKMVVAGCDGVMALGKASPGEKTMVDALKPAADAIEISAASGSGTAECAFAAAQAAASGAEATKDMVATKGRGRYQGENGRGHIDAGAVSVSLIMRQLSQALSAD